MTTPIDRESVERWECSACPRTMDPEMAADPLGDWVRYEDFCAALDAAEAENKRLREALMRIQHENQQQDGNEYWKTRDGYWAAIARATLAQITGGKTDG